MQHRTLITSIFASLAITASTLSSQSVVKDPFFKSSSAWTIVDTSRTKVVKWSPLTIDVAVTSSANAGKTVGVRQTVNITADGAYQLIMNASTDQSAPSAALAFDCVLMQGSTKVLDASGLSHPGPDTRMTIANLKKGSYELRVTSKTVLVNTIATRRIVNTAVFLRSVKLPCANFKLESKPVRANQQIEIRGSFSPGARSALYYFSTHRTSTPLRFPGVLGDVFLDPSRGSGIHVTLLEPTSKTIVIGPWASAWPGYHCQVVEVDASQRILRIGSRTFTRP